MARIAKQHLTTEDVAKLAGVTARQIYRWLESRQLAEPAFVTSGNRKIRLWTKADVKRVKKLLKQHRAKTYGAIKGIVESWGQSAGQQRTSAISQISEQIAAVGRSPELTGPPSPELKGRSPEAVYRGPMFVGMQMQDELLTIEQLAQRLGVKKSVVYELTRTRGVKRSRKRGEQPFPCVRINGRPYFPWSNIVQYFNEQLQAQRQGK